MNDFALEVIEEKTELVFEGESETVLEVTDPEIQILTACAQGISGRDGRDGRDGSGLGWLFYKDAQYTAAAKRHVPANTRTQITCDGLSPVTTTQFKPTAAIWFDILTNKFVPDALGDSFLIRLNLKMSANMNNRTAVVDFDIGTANFRS